MGECEEEIDVFMAWAQARARRMILKHAIGNIMPMPERANNSSFAPPKNTAASRETTLFDAISRTPRVRAFRLRDVGARKTVL